MNSISKILDILFVISVTIFVAMSVIMLFLQCVGLVTLNGGLAAAVLNVLGNLPYIIIQRFNRPRLVRLLVAHSKRTIMRCEDYACADTQL